MLKRSAAVLVVVMVLLVVSLLVLTCGASSRDPIVDGWPIGAPLDCPPENPCVELMEMAARQLDRRDPDHAAVVGVAWHQWGRIVDDDGRILVGRSGRWYVARYELADGSVRAIGVGFPGISDVPVAGDYGP